MTQQRTRNKRLQQLTLLLTVVLAVALGGILYLSVTSLPYLATSPTTDPQFGALNACLLSAVPERVGFAVSRDGARVAAWSTKDLVECAGAPPQQTVLFSRPAVRLATYDGNGALWISEGGGEAGALLRLEAGEFVERGTLNASGLVGTAQGVVVLESNGNLVAVSASGDVTATRALPSARGVTLQTNAEGTHVAVWGGGRFAVIDAKTLESTPAEVPCPVRQAWWRPAGPLIVVECLDIAIELNALTSESSILQPRRRVASTLVGPGGTYVQACDMLPCTVEAPR